MNKDTWIASGSLDELTGKMLGLECQTCAFLFVVAALLMTNVAFALTPEPDIDAVCFFNVCLI